MSLPLRSCFPPNLPREARKGQTWSQSPRWTMSHVSNPDRRRPFSARHPRRLTHTRAHRAGLPMIHIISRSLEAANTLRHTHRPTGCTCTHTRSRVHALGPLTSHTHIGAACPVPALPWPPKVFQEQADGRACASCLFHEEGEQREMLALKCKIAPPKSIFNYFFEAGKCLGRVQNPKACFSLLSESASLERPWRLTCPPGPAR